MKLPLTKEKIAWLTEPDLPEVRCTVCDWEGLDEEIVRVGSWKDVLYQCPMCDALESMKPIINEGEKHE